MASLVPWRVENEALIPVPEEQYRTESYIFRLKHLAQSASYQRLSTGHVNTHQGLCVNMEPQSDIQPLPHYVLMVLSILSPYSYFLLT